MKQHYVWTEKYRPKTVSECVLPKRLKDTFQAFVDQGNIPNLILDGSAGTGKTTVAKAMCNEIGADYIVINGSLNAGIDTLRNEIQQFASTVSFSGGRKFVILDEGDYLSNTVQAALRNFMEEYSSNCGFIITCNFVNRIIEPLHSRCTVINMRIHKEEKPEIASLFMKRCIQILEIENQTAPISWDKKAIAAVVTKYFPDFRRTLNELQRYGQATGTIDSGILVDLSEESFDKLVSYIKERDFTSMRKWVAENSDVDTTSLFRQMYDRVVPMLEPITAPQLVLILGEYQYKSALVADQEINTAACFTEIMANVSFK